MKFAIILTTTKNTSEFSPSKGLFNKNCHDLELAGYTLIHLHVKDTASIKQLLSYLPEESIGLVWFRMHGSPQTMTTAQDMEITSNNIPILFDWLPAKLTREATIYLDACSTASLKAKFYNNIQFTFAKLTLDLPNVQIVGPSENCHVGGFKINSNNQFVFEMYASPRSTENMAIVLQQQTKVLLQSALNEHISLDSMKEELEYSLIKHAYGSFLDNFSLRLHSILLDSNGYDLEETAILTITHKSDCLEYIKELVETFQVSLLVRNPHRHPICWSHATILSTAVCAKKWDVVSYLLEKGANPLHDTLKGQTLYDFIRASALTDPDYREISDLIYAHRQDFEDEKTRHQEQHVRYIAHPMFRFYKNHPRKNEIAEILNNTISKIIDEYADLEPERPNSQL